jgi:hypothetical protein
MAKFTLADSSLHSIKAPVGRCYLGKLYYLGFGRLNQFGPSRTFTQGDINSLYLDLNGAMKYIEPRRKQGRYWMAIDVPVVVIEAEDAPKLLIVGNGWGHDTLLRFRPKLPPQRKFGLLARSLMSQLPKDVWALQSQRNIPQPTFPFRLNQSVSRSGKLDWYSEWWINDPKSAINLLATLLLWLSGRDE